MNDILDRTSTRQKFLVDLTQFKRIEKINKGGFGDVYKIQNQTTHQYYAAKILISENDQMKKMINREIGIMSRLHHSTLVQFHGYSLHDFNGENNVTIIMNLYPNGSLATLLENSKKGLAPESYDNTSRQKILIGIARGMKFLHQNHTIHRDLKPGNILLDDNYHPHITDFGLSKIYDNDYSISQTQTIGTSIYMAPEMINSDHYNGKVDVYSFGIIMYEVITDSTPYPLFQSGKLKLFQLQQKIVNEKYRPEFKVPVKNYLKELIVKCWSDDPKERPTFDEIYKKLSFNMEESVYDVFEDDTEYKFYLDDVDSNEVLSYVYDINENDQTKSSNSFFKNSIDSLQNQLNEQIKKVNELSTENKEIKSQSIEQKNTIKNLLNENQQMKMDISNQDKKINDLLNENQQMKIQIDELKKQLIKKPFDSSSVERKSIFFGESPINPYIKEPITKRISEPTINPSIKEPITKRISEPTINPYIKEPITKIASEPTINPYIKEPITKIASESPINSSIKAPIDKTASESPINSSIKAPIDKTASEPIINPYIKSPIDKTASESPINPSIKAPITKIAADSTFNPSIKHQRKKSNTKFFGKTSSSPIQTNSGVFTFTPFNPETDGIFYYLTKKEGKNIHDSGKIKVTTNSMLSDEFHPKNLLNFGKDIYIANLTNSIMIIFDFKQIKIDITGYVIKTSKGFPNQGQPKSWKLEISNDLINWDIIDEINNCQKLNKPDTTQLFFNVERKYFARYCRFNHADDCWMDTSSNFLTFKAIDFFGDVKI